MISFTRIICETKVISAQIHCFKSILQLIIIRSRCHTESIHIVNVLSIWKQILQTKVWPSSDVKWASIIISGIISINCDNIFSILYGVFKMQWIRIKRAIKQNIVHYSISKNYNSPIITLTPPRSIFIQSFFLFSSHNLLSWSRFRQCYRILKILIKNWISFVNEI